MGKSKGWNDDKITAALADRNQTEKQIKNWKNAQKKPAQKGLGSNVEPPKADPLVNRLY